MSDLENVSQEDLKTEPKQIGDISACGHDKCKEYRVISFANACAQPDAVVVKVGHALVADGTMLRARRLFYFASWALAITFVQGLIKWLDVLLGFELLFDCHRMA